MNQELKSSDLVESFSGIRGIYGKGITKNLLKKYLFSYFEIFPKAKEKFLIANDTRPSSPLLKKTAIEYLEQAGVKEVFDAGIAPVQVAEYAVSFLHANGGLYISASHNEPEYNGFKFLGSDGAILRPKEAEKLISLANNRNYASEENKESSSFIVKEISQLAVVWYIDYVLEKAGKEAVEKIKKARFRILVDPNGGSAIAILEKLFQRLQVKAEIINNELGKFNRLIEPNAESLEPLAELLKKASFSFAAGFDADADRMELVIKPFRHPAGDILGPVLRSYYVLALAMESFLQGAEIKIAVNVDASSYALRDVLQKYGVIVKEVEVGEVNVVEGMEKEGALIGGEGSSSGGVITKEIKCRDGIMSLVLILKLLAQKEKSLVEALKDYPLYFSERTKLNCLPEQAVAVRNSIDGYFKEKGYKVQKTGDETGGLKIFFDNNSFLWFRQSKTEPGVFRVWADGDNKEKVRQILKQGIAAFNSFC